MRKCVVLFLTYLIYSNYLFAQVPAIEWAKCLGGSFGDGAQSIHHLSGGGYIMAGNTVSTDGDVTGNHGGQDCWVVKTDDAGVILWQKCLGGTDMEDGNDLIETSDGGFMLAASVLSGDGDLIDNLHADGSPEVWLVKLSGSGAIQWRKCYGGANSDGVRKIRQTPDGGYIFAGYSASTNGNVLPYTHGGYDAWIVKTDDTGAILWQRKIGGSDDDYATDVEFTGGGYVVAGYSYSSNGDMTGNHGDEDGWVAKLDDTGGVSWIKCIGGSSTEAIQGVAPMFDGGYLAVGSTHSNDGDVSGNNGDYDYWLVKLNGAGVVQWQKCFGGSGLDYAHAFSAASNNIFFLSGSSSSSDGDVTGNHGSSDGWVIKIDSTGNMQWEKSLGGSQGEEIFAATGNPDGTCTVAGTTYSNDGDVSGNHSSYGDVWVVKLSPFAMALGSVADSHLDVLPNPSNGDFHVSLPQELKGAELTVTDVLGRFVFSATINGLSDEIHLAELPGLYFARVQYEDKVYTSKLVIR